MFSKRELNCYKLFLFENMKKILIFTLICFCSHFAYSQVLVALLFGDKLNSDKLEFGLAVSPTFSTISDTDGDYKSGLGLSLYFNLKMNPNLYLHMDLAPKSSFGTDNLAPYATGIESIDGIYLNNENTTVLRKIKAISIPLLVRYRIKGLLFAEAGPQFNIFLKSRDIFTTEINNDELTYEVNINDRITFMDAGLAGGIEYKLKKEKGIGIGVRYYYGLTDIMKQTGGSQKNSAVYLRLLVPIVPKSKAK